MAFEPTLAQLERWVSKDRLTKYVVAPADTVALYQWNADLTGALFELIGHTEIMLRNVIHDQLAPHSPAGAWYDDSHYPFNPNAQREIRRAKARAASGRPSPRPGKVVAELNFGFWRYLLTATYQTTVWPRVSPGFAGTPRHQRNRRTIEETVTRIHGLRNRVAHHEPVFHTDLAQHVRDLEALAGSIDPAAPLWFQEISRVQALLAARPSRPSQ